MPLPPIAFMVSTNSGLPIMRIFWPFKSSGLRTGFLVYRLREPPSIQARPISLAGLALTLSSSSCPIGPSITARMWAMSRKTKGMLKTLTSGTTGPKAYDAASGKQAWRWFVVPGDPAKGLEDRSMEMALKSWKGQWWKYGGGGTPWDGLAYDPAANLVYVGTGNGSPWARDHRSPGGGDNLYLSSIVALNADTGRYVWHYQTTPGDDWDYNAAQPMILADLTIGGRPRKVLLQAPKNGFFYVIDRLTGELLSAQPFTNVNWATHIDLKTGRPVETPDARYGAKGSRLSPSAVGAHHWPPMAFNPTTGLVYFPGQDTSMVYKNVDTFTFQEGQWNTGTLLGGAAAAAIAAAPDRKSVV